MPLVTDDNLQFFQRLHFFSPCFWLCHSPWPQSHINANDFSGVGIAGRDKSHFDYIYRSSLSTVRMSTAVRLTVTAFVEWHAATGV